MGTRQRCLLSDHPTEKGIPRLSQHAEGIGTMIHKGCSTFWPIFPHYNKMSERINLWKERFHTARSLDSFSLYPWSLCLSDEVGCGDRKTQQKETMTSQSGAKEKRSSPGSHNLHERHIPSVQRTTYLVPFLKVFSPKPPAQ